MTDLYHPPVKRSVEIAGHKTSISLEPLFWAMLRQAAAREGLPVNALVARIDAERVEAQRPPGLATAIRLWLASELCSRRHAEPNAGWPEAPDKSGGPPQATDRSPGA